MGESKKKKKKAPAVDNDANPDNSVIQHEFVNALVRLGRARYPELLCGGNEYTGSLCPLANCLDALMEQHVIPFATFDVRDAVSVALKTRLVRAVLAKYEEPLEKLFNIYAKADGGVGGGGGATMNLNELIAMLKDMKMLDDKCTQREVTTFCQGEPRRRALPDAGRGSGQQPGGARV